MGIEIKCAGCYLLYPRLAPSVLWSCTTSSIFKTFSSLFTSAQSSGKIKNTLRKCFMTEKGPYAAQTLPNVFICSLFFNLGGTYEDYSSQNLPLREDTYIF